MDKKQYPYLDGLRGLSALGVAIFHSNPLVITAGTPFFIAFLAKLMGAGRYGVSIFFVLSGFLITGLLISKDDRRPNIFKFYAHRAFKILPSYFFLLGIMLALNAVSMAEFLKCSRFAPNCSPLNVGHLWSIAVEVAFYLIYPVIFYLIFCLPRQRSRRGILLIALLAVTLADLFYKLHTDLTTPDPWEVIIRSPVKFFIQNNHDTFCNIDALAFGSAIRLLENRITALRQSVKNKLLTAICLLGAFLWALLIGDWKNYLNEFDSIAAGLLIIACLLGLKPLLKFLEFKPFQSIGKISYNLYLWHYPLLMLSPQELKRNLFFFPCYLLTTLLAGWAATATVERLFLKLRQRFIGASTL